MTSRHLEVIYCDDIREEVGNKFSYIGVYGAELKVTGAPHTLSKLCVAVRLVTTAEDPVSSLEIQISRGAQEEILASTGSVQISDVLATQPDDASVLLAHFAFVLSPFLIDESTMLNIKAITEREELRGTPLKIRVLPNPAVQ